MGSAPRDSGGDHRKRGTLIKIGPNPSHALLWGSPVCLPGGRRADQAGGTGCKGRGNALPSPFRGEIHLCPKHATQAQPKNKRGWRLPINKKPGFCKTLSGLCPRSPPRYGEGQGERSILPPPSPLPPNHPAKKGQAARPTALFLQSTLQGWGAQKKAAAQGRGGA